MAENKKISELDPAADPTGNENIEVLQVGNNLRLTLTRLKNWLSTAIVNYIPFNTNPSVIITDAGTVQWNNAEYTIDIVTGLGATIQVGQETLLLVYNGTAGIFGNGKTLHPQGVVQDVGGLLVSSMIFADASTWSKCYSIMATATHDIGPGEIGLATVFGRVRDVDTSGITGIKAIYLSPDGTGSFTDIKPVFPDYTIQIGGNFNNDAVNGVIIVNLSRGGARDTFNDAWDGAVRESFDFVVSSNGTVVTGSLTNVDPLMDLTLLFSDGFYTFDVTPAATIVLTAGTDAATQSNFVYIPISTKVLTLSTTGFPTTEHCKIAQLEVQSAVTVQTELGSVRNQNLNDHLKTEADNGHILHIADRIRQLNAEHDNGTEGSLTGTPTNGYIQVTGGQVWQMHKQTVSAFSMPTQNIIIANDFTTANRRTNNLNTITAYSDGSSWSNEWSKVVVWGVANKTGEPDFVQLNLPSAGYNLEANAIDDALNYADYTIPKKFKGVGFLIGAFTFRVSGGTITYNGGTAYQDLRGFIPNNIAGGGGGSGVTSLLGLDDVFIASYAGKAGELVYVNAGETGVDSSDTIPGAKTFNGNFGVYRPGSSLSNSRIPDAGNTFASLSGETGEGYHTISTDVATSDGLVIGGIQFGALADDEVHRIKAVITVEVDGVNPGSRGGVLKFWTNRDGYGSLHSRFEIDTNGLIYIIETPATSATTTPILTRNASTGAIEQIIQLTTFSIASASTITQSGSARENEWYVTALAAALTFGVPTGTIANGNTIIGRVKDNGTARALTFNAIFRAVGVTIPTTTVINKTLYWGAIYNSTDSKWDIVSVVQES